MKISKGVCEQIARRIEYLGVTQAELARRVGMQPSHLNRFLRGHGDIRSYRLMEILAEIGFDLEQMMAMAPLSRGADLAVPATLSRFERRTIETLVARFHEEACGGRGQGAYEPSA